MQIQTAKNLENLNETEKKHIPVLEFEGMDVIIRVGNIAHPMNEGHYIEWIELYHDNHLLSRKSLKPKRKPEAVFHLKEVFGNLYAISFCNLHGAWRSNTVIL